MKNSKVLNMLAGMAALSGYPGCPFNFRPSGADIRNDPDREKTQDDLDRMEAAQKKRDRKAARDNSRDTMSGGQKL